MAQFTLILGVAKESWSCIVKKDDEPSNPAIRYLCVRKNLRSHVVMFFPGRILGVTVKIGCGRRTIERETKADYKLSRTAAFRYNDFIAVPSLSVMAVDDRGGELHLGGKEADQPAAFDCRESEDYADIQVQFEATPEEVRQALRDWSLTWAG